MNMRKMISLFMLGCLVLSCNLPKDAIHLKPTNYVDLTVSEPSDIAINPLKKDHFFVASDDGYLAEININGETTRIKEFDAYDVEGVYANTEFVYAVDEFTRNITVFNHDLEVLRTINIPYGGGRNRSYEAFTYNEAKKMFLLFTEKNPVYLFELTEDLQVYNQINLGKIARDISAASFYNGFVYLLSDEDKLIFKLDPNTYEILQKWYVPVVNPEGLAFTENGKVLIISDDRERLYYFNSLD